MMTKYESDKTYTDHSLTRCGYVLGGCTYVGSQPGEHVPNVDGQPSILLRVRGDEHSNGLDIEPWHDNLVDGIV